VFVPVGAGKGRRLVPWVTLAIIAVNVVIHVATRPVVAADEARMMAAGQELTWRSMEIELRHRGIRRVIKSYLDLEGTRGGSDKFWWRWENGLIVPKHDEQWVGWSEARDALRAIQRTTFHYRYGIHGAAPTPHGLIAHAFLHGGWLHLLGNMLFLWVVGANMEEVWGRRWLALLYAVGIVAACMPEILFPPKDPDAFGIGASGAVAAVMGAMLIRNPMRKIYMLATIPMIVRLELPAIALLVPWIVGQLVAVNAAGAAEAGIGYSAHIGGFFGGALLALGLRLGGVESRDITPVVEAEKRRLAREELLRAADELVLRNDAKGALAKIREALAVDPDDLAIRERLIQHLGALKDRDAQAAEGDVLLNRLWRLGERDRFLALFRWLEAEVGRPLSGSLAHRAAWVLEAREPVEAARLYERALRDAPEDPLADRSLDRFATFFESTGRPGEARQVRDLREAARRRARREATGS